MVTNSTLLALDVGSRRIGVARAEIDTKLAVPLETVVVDDTTIEHLVALFTTTRPVAVVVGYPRNQSGEPTAQTAAVETFVTQLKSAWDGVMIFQDESLTSVVAEDRLRQRKKPYSKADVDAEAAAIILQDYIEANYGY
ncbi:MAG TPA: Holliday junction resolvase RuvX [Candidatus Saccharibacteria bacterium]|nr:Holliday junction resolvase RuvX [Candidatus Saccharibacteria bacterium]